MRAIFDNPALLIVLILLVVLLFGAKRLPDAARSIGRSMRIFKSEVKEMKTDDERHGQTSSPDHEGTPSRPLEGRVVDEQHRGQPSQTSTSYDQQRHSA